MQKQDFAVFLSLLPMGAIGYEASVLSLKGSLPDLSMFQRGFALPLLQLSPRFPSASRSPDSRCCTDSLGFGRLPKQGDAGQAVPVPSSRLPC